MLFGICSTFGVEVSFCINNGVVVPIKTFYTYLKGERMFFIHFVIRGQDSGDVALENMIAPVNNIVQTVRHLIYRV